MNNEYRSGHLHKPARTCTGARAIQVALMNQWSHQQMLVTQGKESKWF